MRELVNILMERDGLTKSEVLGQIKEFKELFFAGELGPDLEEAFQFEFSLEPDYIVEIL